MPSTQIAEANTEPKSDRELPARRRAGPTETPSRSNHEGRPRPRDSSAAAPESEPAAHRCQRARSSPRSQLRSSPPGWRRAESPPSTRPRCGHRTPHRSTARAATRTPPPRFHRSGRGLVAGGGPREGEGLPRAHARATRSSDAMPRPSSSRTVLLPPRALIGHGAWSPGRSTGRAAHRRRRIPRASVGPGRPQTSLRMRRRRRSEPADRPGVRTALWNRA